MDEVELAELMADYRGAVERSLRYEQEINTLRPENSALKTTLAQAVRALAWISVDAIQCPDSEPKQWVISDGAFKKVEDALEAAAKFLPRKPVG